MTKYIFVTGGVLSSLGKGITAASVGALLKHSGIKVGMLKIDPYINVDPGTMSPLEHGEVFVTKDGAETDLDIGNYERFLNDSFLRTSNFTTGQVYSSVIERERSGGYLGQTIQVVPHIVGEIVDRIKKAGEGHDILVVELGGTVGDIEGLPFMEAIRTMKHDDEVEGTFFIHVTLIPFIKAAGEHKSKPTQHSVQELRRIGITPQMIIARSEEKLPKTFKKKLALACDVSSDSIIEAMDEQTIYAVPLSFLQQNILAPISKELGLGELKPDMEQWDSLVKKIVSPKHLVTIGFVGKYLELKESYKSLIEALIHSGAHLDTRVAINWIDSEKLEVQGVETLLADCDSILVAGGFGNRGVEGKIAAIRYAREKRLPYLGICLGMQLSLVEYARNVLGFEDANSIEFNPNTTHPMIYLIDNFIDQSGDTQLRTHHSPMGGTLRLGEYPCETKEGSHLRAAYNGEALIFERHRHRYEANPTYREALENAGMIITGESNGLIEAVEIPTHPWFLGYSFILSSPLISKARILPFSHLSEQRVSKQTLPNPPLLGQRSLEAFLSERFHLKSEKLSDIPHPSQLKDAAKAAERIANAIKNKERIALVGDYDVDGVTSTAIVKRFFHLIGYPLFATIPNRFTDGYGVSKSVLERIDADVVFTVDNGINAIEAAQVCKARGIDLIITDHHTPSDILPDVYAIVNPKQHDCPYPFKDICGAQVAWLLMGLIKSELGLTIDMRQFFPFLALAIVADVMPLIGINRAIVKAGLEMMNTSSIPAFTIIRDVLNKTKISSEDIGFQIAPRINSAGRLEDASIALEFLVADTVEKAYHQFELLTSLNGLRKEIEAQTTAQAMTHVNPNDSIIVVAGEGWNEGVVGIVASRLVNHFQKPAIVLSIHNGIAKGSGRSIGAVDLYTLIKSQEHLLAKFGGHKMAAGLSMEEGKVQQFRQGINDASTAVHPDDFIPQNDVIGELEHDAINSELLSLLERFEPYGEGNPRPRFLLRDAHVVGIKLFGSDKSHSRLELQPSPLQGKTLEFIAFRRVLEAPASRKMSCSYTVNKNEFNGKISMQLMVERLF